MLPYWRDSAEERPPRWAEDWAHGHQERLWEWGFPCLQEGRKAKQGGCWALPLPHGDRRQHPDRFFSEVHSKSRRQLSQAAGKEIPAGQKEKIIFPRP